MFFIWLLGASIVVLLLVFTKFVILADNSDAKATGGFVFAIAVIVVLVFDMVVALARVVYLNANK